MAPAAASPRPRWLHLACAAGLSAEFHPDGSLRRLARQGPGEHSALMVNAYPAPAVEAGLTGLWLRRRSGQGELSDAVVPLIGPLGVCGAARVSDDGRGWVASGRWQGLAVTVAFELAADRPAWCWRVRLDHDGGHDGHPVVVDLVHALDLGLSPYAALRLNEYYVSHYLDLAPLAHAELGWLLAARQNLAVDRRHPWLLCGSMDRAAAWATDARQLMGQAARTGAPWPGLAQGLPSQRLQQEPAMAALQGAPLTLAPGQSAQTGFWAWLEADHPAATDSADLAVATQAQAWLAGLAPLQRDSATLPRPGASLYARAPWRVGRPLDEPALDRLFGAGRRHEERDADGTLLSFFHGPAAAPAHVVLAAKEAQVQRPHGHLLRAGDHAVPDEAALTSTCWMGGAFHSMLTQGHVSLNRGLSTVRTLLGAQRSAGLRAFIALDGQWQQLGLPSAFEMHERACRWLYRLDDAGWLLEISSHAGTEPEVMHWHCRVLDGAPVQLRLGLHLAVGGDDGQADVAVPWHRDGDAVVVPLPAGSEGARRFPAGCWRVEPAAGCHYAAVAGDGALYEDGQDRGDPWLCLDTGEVRSFGLRLVGALLAPAPVAASELALPRFASGDAAARALAEILPWWRHNALVHYLAPRGLEQYSGGGWGTRDVCQGPLEMLLALGATAPVRDLLQRVFSAQNPDGDWPQWFMFFPRDAAIRAGDAHGDIVFWPLLALARYLLASGDASLLDAVLPFHAAPGTAAQQASVEEHVRRSLALIAQRQLPGTALEAYGHGDWNDALQPADPALREHLCSAWTVTLHHQTLDTLARALRSLGRDEPAAALEATAAQVQADFRQHLLVDGVVAGYRLSRPGQAPQWLLHPRDALTGLRASLLPMMHAILENLLTPEEAQAHRALIEAQLCGPDGARLFDRPLAYRGGPQQLFQRAESAAYFGREIGVMYMHAHLRWAEALAHLGEAERFWQALQLAHPIGLTERLPQASRRQANCYYSSSDAAFADRYEAQAHYGRIARGEVALDGGWRVYSSGPGIAIGLVVGSLFGLRQEAQALVFDPVMPAALDGLTLDWQLAGRPVQLRYHVGPRGCGVQALRLDGLALPFVRRRHAYRTGAAVVTRAQWDAALAALDGRDPLQPLTLGIHLG